MTVKTVKHAPEIPHPIRWEFEVRLAGGKLVAQDGTFSMRRKTS